MLWVYLLHGLALALGVDLVKAVEVGGAVGAGLLAVVAGGTCWWGSVRITAGLKRAVTSRSIRLAIFLSLPLAYFAVYLALSFLLYD